MLQKSAIEQFLNELPESSRIGLQVMESLEDWPVDDQPDVSALLDKISIHLDEDSGKKKFLNYSPEKLLKATSYLSSPRFARVIKLIGEQNHQLIAEMIRDDKPETLDIVSAYKATFLIRVCHMIRFKIADSLVGPERVQEIVNDLLRS